MLSALVSSIATAVFPFSFHEKEILKKFFSCLNFSPSIFQGLVSVMLTVSAYGLQN